MLCKYSTQKCKTEVSDRCDACHLVMDAGYSAQGHDILLLLLLLLYCVLLYYYIIVQYIVRWSYDIYYTTRSSQCSMKVQQKAKDAKRCFKRQKNSRGEMAFLQATIWKLQLLPIEPGVSSLH